MKFNDSPLISIIIPTYNREFLLRQAIESVVSQTYTKWEVIVVDNFSTDGTIDLVESFGDPRIILILSPRTGSVAASRNVGMKAAKGNWLAFLDSDDWWEPNKLERLIEIGFYKSDLIYHDLQIVSLDGTKNSDKKNISRKLKSPIYMDLLLNGNAISLSSVVVKKSIFISINGMDESLDLFAVEDYDAWLRLAQITEKFLYLPENLGYYRLHDNNIGKINNFLYLNNALAKHLNILNDIDLKRFQSLYVYQIARRHYLNNCEKKSLALLFFVCRFGKFEYKLKSFFMIIQMCLHGVFPQKEDLSLSVSINRLLKRDHSIFDAD